MKRTLNFSALSILLLLIGCNEKVSPELQGANSSTTVGGTEVPDEFYFQVTNESPTILNYKIHQTGSGNATTACEVRKNVPLTNLLYTAPPFTSSDVTCFMEVEELSLHHGGMSLGINASKNTCEYIGYSPFSWYNRMPGNSSSTILKVTCADGTITGGNVVTAANSNGFDTSAHTDGINCNRNYLDLTIADPGNERSAFTVTDDEDLCRFNYKDGDEEQCDEGVITIQELEVSIDSTTLLPVGEVTTTTLECGGKAVNCIRGPVKDVTDKGTRFTEITATEVNQEFKKAFEYTAPIEADTPNFEIVNYRRDLASFNIDFEDGFGTTESYMNSFGGAKDYTPIILDRYSNNKTLDNTDLIDSTLLSEWSFIYQGNSSSSDKIQRVFPLAAEPFLGLGGNKTNPFYTFYCFDNAFDIKARIRVIVREWDRVFPSNTNLELISDINLSTNARQDVFNQEEILNDQDPWNAYNDLVDWDDIISMTRTSGGFDASTTTWRPSPSIPVGRSLYFPSNSSAITPFTDGFFNDQVFPNVIYEEN
jgi:hypothetical protein